MKIKLNHIRILGVAFAAALWGASLSLIPSAAKAEPFAGDRIIGDPNAPVTVIEYASLGCPHCKSFHEAVWPDFKSKYIETGKVKFIFRVFPFHLQDLRAETLARCGGEDRYDAFIDVLFKRQRDWLKETGFMDVLGQIGLQGGISAEQYAACQADEALQQSILERRNQGVQAGINSTPSFQLEDGTIVSGVQDMDDWKDLLGDLDDQASNTGVMDGTDTGDMTFVYAGLGVAALAGVGGLAYTRRKSSHN